MKTVEPRYIMDRVLNPNYGPGLIGFSYRDNSVVSKGVALFTQEEHDRIVPTHAFIVRDKNTLIEALMPDVHEKKLEDYFDDPHTVVFFKRPKGLTQADVNILIFVAIVHLGRKLTAGPNACSELIAYCLKMVPKYANLFPLSEYHPSKIDPLMLVRSEELFNIWSFDETSAT